MFKVDETNFFYTVDHVSCPV